MTRPVEISHSGWDRLYKQLCQDCPSSVTLIRHKMKEKLGFVAREYRDWDNENFKWRKNCVMLDFYDEKKRTFFLMKYSHFFDEKNLK